MRNIFSRIMPIVFTSVLKLFMNGINAKNMVKAANAKFWRILPHVLNFVVRSWRRGVQSCRLLSPSLLL